MTDPCFNQCSLCIENDDGWCYPDTPDGYECLVVYFVRRYQPHIELQVSVTTPEGRELHWATCEEDDEHVNARVQGKGLLRRGYIDPGLLYWDRHGKVRESTDDE